MTPMPSADKYEITTDRIKYNGATPVYTYWLETDGAWHALARHWRMRPSVRLRQLNAHMSNLIWDEQRQRFVAAQE